MENEKKAVSRPYAEPDSILARVGPFLPENASGNALGTGKTPPVGGYRARILPRPKESVWVQAIGSDIAGLVKWGEAGLLALAGDGVERRVEIGQMVEYVVATVKLEGGEPVTKYKDTTRVTKS